MIQIDDHYEQCNFFLIAFCNGVICFLSFSSLPVPPHFPLLSWSEFATAYLVGLVFMAFGPSYSYSLIRLLYGQKWSDGEASTALRYYCVYIIVLAMNG